MNLYDEIKKYLEDQIEENRNYMNMYSPKKHKAEYYYYYGKVIALQNTLNILDPISLRL